MSEVRPPQDGSPPVSDVAVHGWSALTVRVAWALLAAGVRVKPAVLRDARDHALLHLAPDTPLWVAEDRATDLTQRFVARARRKAWNDPWPGDLSMQPSPRWRRAIDRSLTSLTAAVFRQHYGDGRRLEQLEKVLGVDKIALEAARGGLREVLRRAALADGFPLEGWPAQRIDRLIGRIAAWSPGPCPPVLEVAEGRHREHLAGCARCDRTWRLLQHEVITSSDLLAPTAGARPQGTVDLLAVHFHPDGKQHRAVVAREATMTGFPVGDDLLLLDASDSEAVDALVSLAAEVSRPHRDHLRTVRLKGPGRWSPQGLLGPLVDRAELEVRSRAWGQLDGAGELPEPIPEPPSASRWWAAVGVMAVAAAGAAAFAFAPPGPARDAPLELEFSEGRGGVWTAFDVPDGADVAMVRQSADGLDVVMRGDAPADKAAYAIGDGGYRVHAVGDGVLVVSSATPIEDLGELVASVGGESALDDLADALAERNPRADIHVWHR